MKVTKSVLQCYSLDRYGGACQYQATLNLYSKRERISSQQDVIEDEFELIVFASGSENQVCTPGFNEACHNRIDLRCRVLLAQWPCITHDYIHQINDISICSCDEFHILCVSRAYLFEDYLVGSTRH